MAERIREQERWIETVVLESAGRQCKLEEMEGEFEELIGMVECERVNKKKLEGEIDGAMEVARRTDGELAEEELERELKEGRQMLMEEENRGKLREDQLGKELQGKDDTVANILQDQ